MEIDPETLAVDVVGKVQPGGHFLAQKHTRTHMRSALVRSNAQQLDANGKYRDLVECAREKVAWIMENHHPEPPSADVQKEIDRILAAADRELKGE